ncbi:GNAT family N-acetyltransferase [Alicyclobacillus suci]|uniref:GNAT family N-acetyltransferase n=1 Tax=Alicyclobacillus suci TaxID=2816080 RepID=UPI001A8D9C12|nr:GNAT family N-acetyltransferase [Alicyclobacillus suci]
MHKLTSDQLISLGIPAFDPEENRTYRAQAIANYITMLIALGRDHGMNHEDLAAWLQSHYEERGYYEEWKRRFGKGNCSALIVDFVLGRRLLYDDINVQSITDHRYIVESATWYDKFPPEAFFYFDVDVEDFVSYTKHLAIANAEKLGIRLHIEHKDHHEIATFEPMSEKQEESPSEEDSITYREKTPGDEEALARFFEQSWGEPIMVSGGEVHDLLKCDTIVAESNNQFYGVLTYKIQETSCEIISIDAVKKYRGIGTRLLEKLIEVAKRHRCTKIRLVTTNDNLEAIRFYQRRGFYMTAIHRGAVDEARKLKPSIPKSGDFGIPIQDEIEFERRI